MVGATNWAEDGAPNVGIGGTNAGAGYTNALVGGENPAAAYGLGG